MKVTLGTVPKILKENGRTENSNKKKRKKRIESILIIFELVNQNTEVGAGVLDKLPVG